MSFDQIRYNAFYYGITPDQFGRLTLGEVLTYIHARDKKSANDQTQIGKLIRWNGWVLVQMLGSGKRKISPQDLFKFADEMELNPHKDPNSPEAKAIFDNMQRFIYKKIAANGNNRKRNDKNRGNH